MPVTQVPPPVSVTKTSSHAAAKKTVEPTNAVKNVVPVKKTVPSSVNVKSTAAPKTPSKPTVASRPQTPKQVASKPALKKTATPGKTKPEIHSDTNGKKKGSQTDLKSFDSSSKYSTGIFESFIGEVDGELKKEARKKICEVVYSYLLRKRWRKLGSVDLITSNFEVNTYCNSPASLPQRKRIKVVKEIIDTEKTYVEKLKFLVQSYMVPLRDSCKDKNPIVTTDALTDIFMNVEMILSVNLELYTKLINRLKKIPNEPHLLADIFVNVIELLKVYGAYVNNYDKAVETVNKLRAKNSLFSSFLDKIHNQDPDRLQLIDYLILPIQRITRYQLLLGELQKSTIQEHIDYANIKTAYDKIVQLTVTLNEKKREQDGVSKILEVQNALGNTIPSEQPLVQPHRRFVKEGYLSVTGVKGLDRENTWFYLFNDCLLCAIKNNASLKFKWMYTLTTIKVVSFSDVQMVIGTPDHEKITLNAQTKEELAGWVTELQNAQKLASLKKSSFSIPSNAISEDKPAIRKTPTKSPLREPKRPPSKQKPPQLSHETKDEGAFRDWDTLRFHLEKLLDTASSTEKKEEELSNMRENLEKEIEKVKNMGGTSSVNVELKQEQLRIKSIIQGVHSSLLKAESTMQILTTQNHKLEKELEILRQKDGHETNHTKQLLFANDALQREREQLEADLDSMNAKIAVLEINNKDLVSRIEKLNTVFKARVAEKAKKLQDGTHLEITFSEMKLKHELESKKLKTLEENNKLLQKDLDNLTHQMKSMDQSIEKLNGENHKLQEEIKFSHGTLEQVSKKKRAAEELKAKLSEAIGKLQDRLTTAASKKNELEHNSITLERELREIKTSLEIQKAEKLWLREQNKKLEELVSSLKQETEKHTDNGNQQSTMQQEYQKKKAEWEKEQAQVKELMEANRELEIQISRLSSNIIDDEAAIANMKATQQLMELEISNLRDLYLGETKARAKFEEMNKKYQHQAKELGEQSDEKARMRKELEDTKEKLDANLLKLINQLAQYCAVKTNP